MNEQIRKVLIADSCLYDISNDVNINIALKGITLEPRIKYDYFYLYSHFSKNKFKIEGIDQNQNFKITNSKINPQYYLDNIVPYLNANGLIHKLTFPCNKRYGKPKYEYILEDFYIVNENKIKIRGVLPIIAMTEWINRHIKDKEFYSMLFRIIEIYLQINDIGVNIETKIQAETEIRPKHGMFLNSIINFVSDTFETYNVTNDELFALIIELLRKRKLYSEFNLLSYELTGFISHLMLNKIQEKEEVKLIYPHVNFDFIPFIYYLRNIREKLILYLQINKFNSDQIDILGKFLSLYDIEIKPLSELRSSEKQKNKDHNKSYNIILLNLTDYMHSKMDTLDRDRNTIINEFFNNFSKNTKVFAIFHRMRQNDFHDLKGYC